MLKQQHKYVAHHIETEVNLEYFPYRNFDKVTDRS